MTPPVRGDFLVSTANHFLLLLEGGAGEGKSWCLEERGCVPASERSGAWVLKRGVHSPSSWVSRRRSPPSLEGTYEMEGGALAWRLSLGISSSSLRGFVCARRTGCLPPQGLLTGDPAPSSTGRFAIPVSSGRQAFSHTCHVFQGVADCAV